MPIEGDAAAAGRPTYTLLGPVPGGGPHTRLVMAHHEGFDRRCVQKTVFLTGPPDVLFAEPRLLDQLRGDDIVTVLDAQYDPHTPGAVTFVMPYYVDGSILDALRAGHQFSLSDVIAILADVLTGMTKLHELGYVDGDMKPGNALLHGGKTRSALGDVGSAAKASSTGAAPMIMWTWIYLAPECVLAGNRVTVRSDVYAVGLTAVEMLNGMFDYGLLSPPTTIPRLSRGLRAIPDRMLSFKPWIPKELRLVIRKAIAVDPLRRYATPRAFLKDLRRLKLVDWRQTARGSGLEGSWEGTWPPHQAVRHRRLYRISVKPVRGRKLRVSAVHRVTPAGSWRRFGVSDKDIGEADSRSLAKIFAEVEVRVRQAVPAQ